MMGRKSLAGHKKLMPIGAMFEVLTFNFMKKNFNLKSDKKW